MASILTAKNRNKTLIYLNGYLSRSELRKLRENNEFYCPDCGGVMLLKVGDIKIPHFAHLSLSACGSTESESAMHLKGKILLHDFFTDRNIPVELEKYLPAIRQRADLLVNSRTALEFQCSPVSASEVARRSAAYAGQELQFTWIAGSREEEDSSVQLVKLLDYQIEMLIGQEAAPHLLLLNPETRKFYYYTNLFPVSGSRWVGKVMALAIEKQTFPFAVPKLLSRHDFEKVCALYAAARGSFIRSQLFAKNRYQNPFWLLTYKLELDKHNLPAVIGVPVFGSQCIAGHAVIWQLKMMRARTLGRSIEEVISSGSIKLQRGGTEEQLRKVLESYIEFIEEMERVQTGTSIQNTVLYDIYCKNVRKLRK